MVSLSEDKKDNLYNALIVGMTADDAYLFAGLTPEEVVWASEDDETQDWMRRTSKQLEYNLLSNMRDGATKQLTVGKTDATQWLLEHLYPRYSAKAAPDIGTISFHLKKEDTRDIESVVNG